MTVSVDATTLLVALRGRSFSALAALTDDALVQDASYPSVSDWVAALPVQPA